MTTQRLLGPPPRSWKIIGKKLLEVTYHQLIHKQSEVKLLNLYVFKEKSKEGLKLKLLLKARRVGKVLATSCHDVEGTHEKDKWKLLSLLQNCNEIYYMKMLQNGPLWIWKQLKKLSFLILDHSWMQLRIQGEGVDKNCGFFGQRNCFVLTFFNLI